ncbi:MAG: GAF domain-containing protein [Acidimicrobiales bacterium]
MSPPTSPLAALAALTDRLGRCLDLDEVLTAALDSLAGSFGFEHSMLLLVDETGAAMFTIASRGYERAGIGSEVALGEGLIGSVAADGTARRIGNLQRLLSYARVARGDPGTDDRLRIPLPGLEDANSQLVAPVTVAGHVLGVLAAESAQLGAFTLDDEHLLCVVAHVVAAAIELDRVGGPDTGAGEPRAPASRPPERLGSSLVAIRFYPVDGSTFIDGDYLIKGVPGRILWRLLRDHETSGRTDFTNREVRLDPTLELPPFRDNLESRLILLKRRLDEREAPMRIEKTGRGRFRLLVEGRIQLDCPEAPIDLGVL